MAEAKLEKQRSDLRAVVDRNEMALGELSRQLWKLESQGRAPRRGSTDFGHCLLACLQHCKNRRPNIKNVYDAAVPAYRAGIGALAKAQSQQHAAVVTAPLMHPGNLPAFGRRL